MKNKKKFLLLISTMIFALGTSNESLAHCENYISRNFVETAEPYSDVIRWIYKEENGKIYKRLYNTSTCEWVGDWIYVCESPE